MATMARRFILGLGFLTVSALAAPPTWYVSPAGNDAWSGTLATANAAKTDGPKASLVAARDASRAQAGTARRIVLGAGRFYMERTLVLDQRDSKLAIEGAGQGKTIVYGGRRLTGWAKVNGKLWSAKLPADLPKWSFRILVVNDAIQDRARLPETGYLEHESTFPVRWMSTAGGGWERKPTMLEYTTMRYKDGDLPAALRIENAEVTVCHMWDESTVGLATHDVTTRTLTFAQRSGHPAGSFNVKRYLVWNTKEGMTRPGQWYLDRVERKVYYWPPDGTDMAKALVVAPLVETLVKIAGQPNQEHVTDVALRDLTLSVTDAPLSPAGFGATKWPGAVGSTYGDHVVVERVEIANAGAWGIKEWAGKELLVKDCQFHHLGGGGVRFGSGARIEGSQIHHIGLVSASAIGIVGGGLKSVIRRNVIHDTPYSGMSVSGTETLI
ncbi:MAG: hypothetical protein HN904_22665, partial [Victivallales bacterium]|nr:hypothetical protein [Victivallales bacterium]